MEKVKVTPTEKNRLYIHPETKQEFPSGRVVEADVDWFVKAKLNLGHLRVVEEQDVESEAPKRATRKKEPEIGDE
ncbi:hypothetical protein ABE205_19530 [Brevibacillus agri]|uniref:hypothetical protein n=1 Tax=Brevibacillus agri TaxID=51101 RepID=UPI003D1AEDD0